MTDDELKRLKREIDEVICLRDNLRATQERCGELLEDSRLKGRRIIVLEAELEAMRQAFDTGIIDLSLEINRPHVHRCVEDGHSYGHGDECHYCGHVDER